MPLFSDLEIYIEPGCDRAHERTPSLGHPDATPGLFDQTIGGHHVERAGSKHIWGKAMGCFGRVKIDLEPTHDLLDHIAPQTVFRR